MKIKIKKFKKVRSTNDIALKLIKKNILEPTLITTDNQTNGRGRAGKKWVSNKGNLPWPLSTGIIVSYFGKQKHEVFSGVETFNNGIDIATDKEAIIRAVFDGVISRIFFIKGVGKAVLINHGEYFTVYSGVKDVLVKVNDKILAKEKIGIVETKYPEDKTELHFEIWKNYEKMDPSKWLYNAY